MMQSTELKLQGEVLIDKCWIARDFFSRLLGLMGKKNIPADEAILFPKCNSIHTFFMRFPIDVAFISETGEIVALVEELRPWKLLLPKRGAKHVLELKAGLASTLGFQVGKKLECVGVWI